MFIAHQFKLHREIAWPIWWLHGSLSMYSSSVNPSPRTFHCSSRRSAKCGILSRLAFGPCPAANVNSIAERYREAHSPHLKTDVHGLAELVNYGVNELGHVCIQYLRTCFASQSLGPRQAGTLIPSSRRYVLRARSCRADVKDHQSVFHTLWRVYRTWSLAIPAQFGTPVSHEIASSAATLFSFRCWLRPAEARQLRWCDVKSLTDPWQHVTKKFLASSTSQNPKRSKWKAMELSNTAFGVS